MGGGGREIIIEEKILIANFKYLTITSSIVTISLLYICGALVQSGCYQYRHTYVSEQVKTPSILG